MAKRVEREWGFSLDTKYRGIGEDMRGEDA